MTGALQAPLEDVMNPDTPAFGCPIFIFDFHNKFNVATVVISSMVGKRKNSVEMGF